MASGKFNWGKVIETFDFDFDGVMLEVVKFHPWKQKSALVLSGDPNEGVVEYHCEELHASFRSFDALLISWITNRRLGLNQHALAAGICKALDIDEQPPGG